MKVMKWGWVLVTLYTGPVALAVYWLSCREPAPGAHEMTTSPRWKQSVGSTIHCMAGDATGVFIAAAATNLLGLPMGVDAALEYLTGFAVGLLIFQALFMKDISGGSYWKAVRGTWLAEWLSMNAVMAGMIPVMIILMTKYMGAMAPTAVRFGGVMSVASLVGGTLAYPVNWWLVTSGLKHGMGTERALGKGGTKVPEERGQSSAADAQETTRISMRAATADVAANDAPRYAMGEMKMRSVSATAIFVVAFITVGMLAGGIALAALRGDLLMRAGATTGMSMSMP
jgi:hypothetical protein